MNIETILVYKNIKGSPATPQFVPREDYLELVFHESTREFVRDWVSKSRMRFTSRVSNGRVVHGYEITVIPSLWFKKGEMHLHKKVLAIKSKYHESHFVSSDEFIAMCYDRDISDFFSEWVSVSSMTFERRATELGEVTGWRIRTDPSLEEALRKRKRSAELVHARKKRASMEKPGDASAVSA